MKKINFIFSGFLASLLLGVGNVNAATSSDPVRIASQKYVDDKETAILENVEQKYAKQETVNQITENVTTVTQQVTQLGDTINNEETGLGAQVDKAVADATAAKEAVDGLTETVNQKADAAALATKEDKDNKAASITAENQTSGTAYPSVGAIVEWTNKKITELSDTGLPVNPDNINDNSIAGSKLENGAVTTDKIADKAVTQEKLSDDLVSEISGKANVSDVYTKLETNEKIVEMENKVSELNSEIEKKNNTFLGEFKVSFYTPTDGSSTGITATGNRAIPYQTVAVDPNVIPLGTRLYIENYGEVIADDVGGAIKGNKLDFCVATVNEAYSNGVQYLNVWIVE